ncbi:MAG: putative AMP-dependent synthetase and ligase [Herbinix sp.]|nr:putative AMP-dependent synthetase and ligase [Herbinix sp.]
MRLSELLRVQSDSQKLAIKYTNEQITYSQWHQSADELHTKLLTINDSKTDSIAVFLPNSIYYAVAYFGVMYSDKILVPIGVQAKAAEISSTVEYCECNLIISISSYKELLLDTFYDYKYKIKILLLDTNEVILINEAREFIESSAYLNQDHYSDKDVAIMLHTSGTTSNPKRVMLTHANLINNVQANIESLRLTTNDIVLIALPMFFGYCNTAQFLTHLYLGATMVILDNIFLPKRFFEIVAKEKITNFTAVPSMLLMLLDYRYSELYDFTTLRYISFGGGKMPVDKLIQLIQKYPDIQFVQTYGQTECAPRVTALLAPYTLSKAGSVGLPIPNVKVKIFDEYDNELKENQIGEIVVQGNNVMKGYYKQPEITAQTIKNGWLKTGDLGYLDQDEFLYITGRIKNIIISGGINIYPEEIEQLLISHDCIDESCVVGENHDLLGEVPVAKVVLKHEITQSELREYCLSRLANYKVPVRFDFVKEIPKTYNGKTKRY